MNEQLRQLAEHVEAARKAVLAMESYLAQVRNVVDQLRQAIAEAEVLVAAGDARE
jgi:hypothetical protein